MRFARVVVLAAACGVSLIAGCNSSAEPKGQPLPAAKTPQLPESKDLTVEARREIARRLAEERAAVAKPIEPAVAPAVVEVEQADAGPAKVPVFVMRVPNTKTRPRPKDPIEVDPEIEFAELSRRFETARRERKRFPSGHIELYELYYYSQFLRGAKTWEDRIEIFKQWREAMPEDVTPVIGLVKLHIRWAWEARGAGFAGTVPEEGWKLFGERLQQALEFARQAEAMPKQDAELYYLLIDIAKGQGLDRQQADEWLRKGREIDPTYYPLYLGMAEYLLPRWHGEPGDLERFAAEMVDVMGGEDGQEVYAWIVLQMHRYDPTLFHGGRYSRQHLYNGMRTVWKRYPESVEFLDLIALAAWREYDHPLAKELRAVLDEKQPELRYWLMPGRYESFCKWCDTPQAPDRPDAALSGDPFPSQAICFTGDSKFLLTSSVMEPFSLKAWDLADPTRPRLLPGSMPQTLIADANGRFVMGSTGHAEVTVWDLGATTQPVVYRAPEQAQGGTLAANGKLAAVFGRDKVYLFDPATGENLKTIEFGAENFERAIKLSPDGKWLVMRARPGVQVWSVETGKMEYQTKNRGADVNATYYEPTMPIEFTDDGWLLCQGRLYEKGIPRKVLFRWRPQTNEHQTALELGKDQAPLFWGGKYYARLGNLDVRGENILIHLYRASDGQKLRTIHGHTKAIQQVAISPDGRWLASFAENSPVMLWRLAGLD